MLINSVAGGLKHSGENGRFTGGKLLQFGRIVIIKNNMSAENLLDDVERIRGNGGDGGVIKSENGDGLTSIDLFEETSFGEIIIESAKFRESIEKFGDVEG